MKYDFMLDILDSVADEHIFECAPPLKAKRKNSFIAKFGIVAACLVVITVSAWLIPKAVKEPSALPFADNDSTTADTERIFPTETATSTQGKDTENTPQSNTTETPTQVTTEPKPEEPVYVDGLQVIKEEYTVPGGAGEGHGFEIYLARDISDLDRGNPWDPTYPLDTLPVYKNLAYNAHPHEAPLSYLSAEEMLEIAEGVAENLGEEILRYIVLSYNYHSVEMENTTEVENPATLFAYTESTVVRVSTTGGYSYQFANEEFPYNIPEKELILPSEFHFEKTTTEDYVKKVVEYINDNYSQYFSSDSFEVVFPLKPYNFEPNQEEQLIFSGGWSVYETVDGDYLQTLMNYYFHTANFGLYDTYDDSNNRVISNKISGISPIQSTSEVLNKLGDYPLITHDEALELLLDGSYITDVFPDALKNGVISREDVHDCELVYRTNKYKLPYYMFFVELKSGCGVHDDYLAEDPTLKLYGTFYVPAIEEKYLEQ